MIVAILLTAYIAVLMIGCHKPKPKTPPPPCSADLFGCYSDDSRAHCVSCERFWNNLDKRKAAK